MEKWKGETNFITGCRVCYAGPTLPMQNGFHFFTFSPYHLVASILHHVITSSLNKNLIDRNPHNQSLTYPRSGCSAVRLARSVRDREVGGSNPLIPTIVFGPVVLCSANKSSNTLYEIGLTAIINTQTGLYI